MKFDTVFRRETLLDVIGVSPNLARRVLYQLPLADGLLQKQFMFTPQHA
jgi:hypothetical protein